MKKEIFKDIPWYEWRYQVSNLGRIKSLERKKYSKWKWIQIVKGRFLIKNLSASWYYKYTLCIDWVNKQITIHRLVAEIFIPNPENKPCINHKDWNKLNNSIENLEWCTYIENSLHSIYILNNNEMLFDKKPVKQYDLEWNLLKNYYCIWEAKRQTKIDDGSICKCCKNERYSAWGFIWKYA